MRVDSVKYYTITRWKDQYSQISAFIQPYLLDYHYFFQFRRMSMNVKPITWHPRKTYIFVFESWNWISTAASLSRSPVEPKVSKWSLQSKDFLQWEIFPPFHSKSFLKFFCFLSCAFSFSVFWAVFILFLFLTQINFNLLSSKTSREFCLADLARNREKYTSSLISGNKLSILKLDFFLTLSSSNKLNKAELTVTPIADTPTIVLSAWRGDGWIDGEFWDG